MGRRELFVTHAFGIQLTRLKTFQHHVRAPEQPAKCRASRFLIEVEDLARFACVQMRESCAQLLAIGRLNEWRQLAYGVASRRFDLYNFHPQVGEDSSTQLTPQVG